MALPVPKRIEAIRIPSGILNDGPQLVLGVSGGALLDWWTAAKRSAHWSSLASGWSLCFSIPFVVSLGLWIWRTSINDAEKKREDQERREE